jgi:hypothetical protein
VSQQQPREKRLNIWPHSWARILQISVFGREGKGTSHKRFSYRSGGYFFVFHLKRGWIAPTNLPPVFMPTFLPQMDTNTASTASATKAAVSEALKFPVQTMLGISEPLYQYGIEQDKTRFPVICPLSRRTFLLL